jgi:hypothetical protein
MTMSNEEQGFYQVVIEVRGEGVAHVVYGLLMDFARDLIVDAGNEPHVRVYHVPQRVSGDA